MLSCDLILHVTTLLNKSSLTSLSISLLSQATTCMSRLSLLAFAWPNRKHASSAISKLLSTATKFENSLVSKLKPDFSFQNFSFASLQIPWRLHMSFIFDWLATSLGEPTNGRKTLIGFPKIDGFGEHSNRMIGETHCSFSSDGPVFLTLMFRVICLSNAPSGTSTVTPW